MISETTAQDKSKYWVAILWLENMRSDWRDKVEELIQFPCVYILHNKDVDSEGNLRKPHVHMMICYNNTTTYKHVLKMFKKFDADPSKTCVNTCQSVHNVRYMYNYFIHDTDDCRKKGKIPYCPSERIECLNFDIGLFEQISIEEKQQMVVELSKCILNMHFSNYADFYNYVIHRYAYKYQAVILSYSSHFERLCRGVYLHDKKE